MSIDKEILSLNAKLSDNALIIFQKIKDKFGFESNAETLRYILVRFIDLEDLEQRIISAGINTLQVKED